MSLSLLLWIRVSRGESAMDFYVTSLYWFW
jgi:hypothetical protein